MVNEMKVFKTHRKNKERCIVLKVCKNLSKLVEKLGYALGTDYQVFKYKTKIDYL